MSDEIDYKNIDLSSAAPGRAGIVFDVYYKSFWLCTHYLRWSGIFSYIFYRPSFLQLTMDWSESA